MVSPGAGEGGRRQNRVRVSAIAGASTAGGDHGRAGRAARNSLHTPPARRGNVLAGVAVAGYLLRRPCPQARRPLPRSPRRAADTSGGLRDERAGMTAPPREHAAAGTPGLQRTRTPVRERHAPGTPGTAWGHAYSVFCAAEQAVKTRARARTSRRRCQAANGGLEPHRRRQKPGHDRGAGAAPHFPCNKKFVRDPRTLPDDFTCQERESLPLSPALPPAQAEPGRDGKARKGVCMHARMHACIIRAPPRSATPPLLRGVLAPGSA